jgi:hypothetical protein
LSQQRAAIRFAIFDNPRFRTLDSAGAAGERMTGFRVWRPAAPRLSGMLR